MEIFLVIAYIFCLCGFSFLGVAWILDGDTGQGLMYLIRVVLMILPVIYLIKRNKSKSKVSKNWTEMQIDKYKLRNSKFVLYGSSDSDYLIYTKDERLVFVNQNATRIKEISLKSILGVKLDILQREKNTRRIISLTPTYDKKVNIEGVRFSVITSSNTYIIEHIQGNEICIDTPLLPPCRRVDIQDKINQIERFKLIIENDIENLKQENI